MQTNDIRKTLLLITVIAAAVMELIDISIVNVSLSHMSGNLGATLEDMSWVITAYAIANVIIIPMTSFLAVKLGRRNYYIGSILAFAFFSFMCGNATNIWTLVVFRFFQGMGGGALLSVSQAVVFELFPPEKRNVASAIFGIGIFTGPTIGPTLGGWITEHYSWPWIFYVNVPIGIIVAASCFILLTEPPIKVKVPKIDWPGILLLSVGVGSLQTVLERGVTEDWFATGYIVVLSMVAFFSLFIFIWWELHTPNPVVNLRVLKSKSLSVASFLTFISGVGLFTSVFLAPVFAQRLLNFTPTQTGLLLLPGALVAIVGLIITARILQKGVSPLLIITLGFILFMVFSWKMSALNLDASAGLIMDALIYRATGFALMTVPLTTLAVSGLAPQDIPQGAALNNMMRQLGGSFGIAMVNTYIHNRLAQHCSDLVTNINAFSSETATRLQGLTGHFIHEGNAPNIAGKMALNAIDFSISKQSFLLSYMDAFLLIGCVFIVSLPLLLLVVKRKNGAPVKVMLSDH